ncbi:MAG: alanine racemase [Candidatus Muiribacteriota bacterium]
MNPTKAIISFDNLKFNLENIRKKTDNKILFAVKANAYGHGDIEIAKFCQENNLVDYFGVATTEEALKLRKGGVLIPILKFSQCFKEDIEALVDYNIEVAAYSEEFILKAQKIAQNIKKKLSIHIKVDTGMGRVGLTEDEIIPFCNKLKTSSSILVKGVMTHFATSDSKNKEQSWKQLEKFKKFISIIKNQNINSGIIHAANSGAVTDIPESYFDMVRPGIMAYGYYPSEETTESVPLKPVMTMISRVSHIKKVPAKTTISYGATYKTFEPSYIATIPVGYGDGYSRSLSNRGKVMIKGKEFKIAGRVCMDQFMIDIGQNTNKIKTGDEVILFGKKAENEVKLNYICSILNTIPYEVLCNVAPRVPRIYR